MNHFRGWIATDISCGVTLNTNRRMRVGTYVHLESGSEVKLMHTTSILSVAEEEIRSFEYYALISSPSLCWASLDSDEISPSWRIEK